MYHYSAKQQIEPKKYKMTGLTEKEIEKYIKEAKIYLSKMTKKEAQKFLQDAKIFNKNGNLTKEYGGAHA